MAGLGWEGLDGEELDWEGLDWEKKTGRRIPVVRRRRGIIARAKNRRGVRGILNLNTG